MKTEWDYTGLAKHYDQRADYADAGLDQLFATLALPVGARIADIGAGTGKLTKALLRRGFVVDAVEPNDEMRRFGVSNTHGGSVRWFEGTGEVTGLPPATYALAAFGSSFNVVDRHRALDEVLRILVPSGHFCCMWNHRDLADPIQARVEAAIKRIAPAYDYGVRREDQTPVIDAHGGFGPVWTAEGRIEIQTTRPEYVEAWRSHGTLQRSAGDAFPKAIEAINEALDGHDTFVVPYVTRIWAAKRKD